MSVRQKHIYTVVNNKFYTSGYSEFSLMTQMPSFDYRGLKCPLPVLKARRALAQVGVGEVVEFWADDPASPLDMSHFCEAEGHQLARSDSVESYFVYHIIKGTTD